MSILQEQLFEFRIDVKVIHIIIVVVLMLIYQWAKDMYKEYMIPTTSGWLASNPVTGTCLSHTGSNQGCGAAGADEGALMNMSTLANSEKFFGGSVGPEFGPIDNDDYLKERSAATAQARVDIAAEAAGKGKKEYATNKDDELLMSMLGA
jgi:hypothetical protein